MTSRDVRLVVEADEELVIGRVSRKAHLELPPFITIGSARMDESHGYDLIDVLLDMNAAEKWFFRLLRDNLDYRTNEVVIPSKSLTKTELNRLSQAYQSLSKKGLVKRLRKEHYLINPDALFYSKTYKEVKQRWESISKKPAKQ